MLNLIIPFFFFFLSTPINFAEAKTVYDMDSSYTTIYLVKQRWHTGILIQTKIVDTLIWKEVNDFKNLDWIDIGWGDEEFYQHPDFDAGLAFRALFYSTPSALRIEGFNISKEKYFKISNIVIELKFDKKMFKNICEYFNKSFKRNDKGNAIKISEKFGGNIKFYRAKGSYNLFNTCNTWVAECFKEAGLDFSTNIILAKELFNEAQKFGKIIKSDK